MQLKFYERFESSEIKFYENEQFSPKVVLSPSLEAKNIILKKIIIPIMVGRWAANHFSPLMLPATPHDFPNGYLKLLPIYDSELCISTQRSYDKF